MKKMLLFLTAALFCGAAFCEDCWSSNASFNGAPITDEPILLLHTDELYYCSALASGNMKSLVIKAEVASDPEQSGLIFSDTTSDEAEGTVCWNYYSYKYASLPKNETYALKETITTDVETKTLSRFVTILPEPFGFLLIGIALALLLRRRAMSAAIVLAVAALGAMSSYADNNHVTSVSIHQNWPFDRSVTIDYTIGDSTKGSALYDVRFYGTLDGVEVFRLSSKGKLKGEGAEFLGFYQDAPEGTEGQVFGIGKHTAIWTPTDSRLENVNTDTFKIRVDAIERNKDDVRYMVIDLSEGPEATNYPVEFISANEAPYEWSSTYKTTKLVLRLIEPGTFMMGSPESDPDRLSNETQHQVTLTKSFYIGVFEVTQKQYELITGNNPSEYGGDKRPVERVSYERIRGTEEGLSFPKNKHVDPDSVLGILRSKIALPLDLPTEAQWEYACRATTTTGLNSGKDISNYIQCPEANEVGRYKYDWNDGHGESNTEHTTVGSYKVNNWGLFDMHGNVAEFCLDKYIDDLGTEPQVDPIGADSGNNILKGGDCDLMACDLRSGQRVYCNPLFHGRRTGFRLAIIQ